MTNKMDELDCKEFNPKMGVYCLYFFIEIGNFICVCILCSLSRKNPFENHIIGDLNLYFLNISDEISVTTPSETISNYTNITMQQKDISEYVISNSSFLRTLVSVSFCRQLYKEFEEMKGEKLSDIFDLNYGKIRKISLANVIISSVIFGIFICIASFRKCLKPVIDNPCVGCLIFCIIFPSYVGRFVLTLIIFYFFEKSDIEKYDNFLECKNIRKEFFKKFSDVNKLRKCFIFFLIINIIIQGVDNIMKCIEFASEGNSADEKKGHVSNNLSTTSVTN